jgi:glycerophosphoryl diester phosphodiesterase
MTLDLEIIAHRGFSAVAPENTLSAMERALEAGADAVEFDLHVARCGTPVLFHDDTLDRTTRGTGLLQEHTFDELRQMDAGGWFAPAFSGEPVPSLEQALACLKGRVGRVYAEVKAWREMGDIDRIVRIVQDADLAYDTVFIAMDWQALDRIASLDDETSIGYIVEHPERWSQALHRAARSRRALLDIDHRLVLANPDWVSEAAAQGVETAVWTCDDPDEAERLADLGVRRFTTNQVDRLLVWRADRAQRNGRAGASDAPAGDQT